MTDPTSTLKKPSLARAPCRCAPGGRNGSCRYRRLAWRRSRRSCWLMARRWSACGWSIVCWNSGWRGRRRRWRAFGRISGRLRGRAMGRFDLGVSRGAPPGRESGEDSVPIHVGTDGLCGASDAGGQDFRISHLENGPRNILPHELGPGAFDVSRLFQPVRPGWQGSGGGGDFAPMSDLEFRNPVCFAKHRRSLVKVGILRDGIVQWPPGPDLAGLVLHHVIRRRLPDGIERIQIPRSDRPVGSAGWPQFPGDGSPPGFPGVELGNIWFTGVIGSVG